MALLFFYKDHCYHCDNMHMVLEDLVEFDGEKVEYFNIDKDSAYEKKLDLLDENGECGGVPFLYDEESELGICGELKYFEVKEALKEYREKKKN